MQATQFNPNDWTYIPDSMGRLGQGFYRHKTDPNQTLSVAEFTDRQQGIKEQKVNKKAPQTQDDVALTPWDNPIAGEMTVKQGNRKTVAAQKAEARQNAAKAPQHPFFPQQKPPAEDKKDRPSESISHTSHPAHSDKDSKSSNNSDSSLVCTELYRQGLLTRYQKEINWHYATHHLSPEFLIGYQFWARPYVNLMQRSSLATRTIRPFVLWRTKAVLKQLGKEATSPLIGQIIRAVHDPICHKFGQILTFIRNPLYKRKSFC